MSGYCETVGIDLGTTRSSVAVWDGVQTHVIANESGENTTPSWVTFLAKNKRRVGKAAERAGSKYISSCVYHFKRLIGRQYEDRMQEEAAALNWPFEVVDEKGNAAMRVTLEDGEEMIVTPEEAAAAVLSYLKKVAEDYTGRIVTKAVVTVPAYFSDSQRQATRDAGLIAGLEVRRILNEPTAAALAFGVIEGNLPGPGEEVDVNGDGFATARESPTNEEGTDPALGGGPRKSRRGKNLLVFDFGGGTLDVTIMLISGSSFKVRATDGDMQLGGEDVDALLVQHFTQVFQQQHGVDIMAMEDGVKRAKALKKLAQGCAMLKVELSRMVESDINVDELVDDFSLESSLKRSELEAIASPILDRIRAPVERALYKVQGGMEHSDIDQVLLVGGSSRIPKVQAILQDMFPGTELCRRINPDEAIVVGAAIEASRAVDMTDVVPRPLCIATANHKDRARSFASEIIPASTPIPPEGISVTECFANSRDNQTTVTIRLCEGEGEYFDDNLRLGVFDISDIPPRPRGQVTIKVTMRVNSDGILTVFAVVEQTGQELNVTVTSNKGRMSDAEIEQKRQENLQFLSNA